MITENRITFGQGTVLVGAALLASEINFRATKDAHTVGELVDHEIIQTGRTISIPLNLQSYSELEDKLKQVEERKTDTFSFCNYVFDFSYYNPESIRVIRMHAKKAVQAYCVALAC